MKISFVSVVRDFEMYNRVIKNNPYVVKDGIILNPIDNSNENIGLPQRYNAFLDRYGYSEPGWIVFCHEDWELLESISEKIKNLDKESLYGVFGARLVEKNGMLAREYVGDIYDCTKKNENLRKVGSKCENLTKVDVLDCQVLIIHSDLVKKYNLRFDDKFEWDLYVEDFCLNAYTKHKIPSRVLNLEICHRSQISDISERPTVIERYPYINKKYKDYTFAGIIFNIGSNIDNIKNIDLEIRIIDGRDRSIMYKHQITSENDARFIAMNYISSNAKILDVGCACGDFSIALKGKRECEIWGMEYNQGSIDIARKTRMFKDIYQIDLNDFNSENFKQFYNFFDYIVFGDVLEHINFPQRILEIFKSFLKSDGEFLLSIPNIAHASIKSNLLVDDFTYTPCGLLDETHVRFFTHKSIPAFLADINLEIIENKFTYQDKIGFQPNNPYDELSSTVKKLIFENFHSYVCQYVMRVKKSELAREEIIRKNIDKLYINDKNAPKGLIEMRTSDLMEVNSEPDNIMELKKIIQSKDQELVFLKSSKFWKLRDWHFKFKFAIFHPLRFFKKYISKLTSSNTRNNIVENVIDNSRYKEYVDFITRSNDEPPKEFVKIAEDDYKRKKNDPKLIAFYLPQFHPIELNDKFYGKGFTDWTNVTKAIPQYTGHYQPHLPIDVGFYDLRNIDIMRQQVEIAKIYGIYGFCFHYYWFSGKRLLEKPLFNWLKNKDIEFPFCLCWANENWAKLWDAGDSELLMKQDLRIDDDEKFMIDVMPFLRDHRYIRIDNKPVLIIYRPHLFEKERAKKLFINFRKIAKENGFQGLYLITANSHGFSDDPEAWGLDAVVEFPPHELNKYVFPKINNYFKNPSFKGKIFDMKLYIKEKKYLYDTDYTLFKTVFPGWDNTARKAYSGASVFDISPALYKEWLSGVIQYTKEKNSQDKQLVFINAWNEWAEGAHLEPSNKYGYAYLQATRDAIEE